MGYAYRWCSNLSGNPACGPKVTNMAYTYGDCPNIYGDGYLYNVTNAVSCFAGRNTSRRLNIYTYIPTTFTSQNITGSALTWTEDTTNKCWYNTTANIYVYQLT